MINTSGVIVDVVVKTVASFQKKANLSFLQKELQALHRFRGSSVVK
jgi:hypothetical protein